jgi:hypothetical protein
MLTPSLQSIAPKALETRGPVANQPPPLQNYNAYTAHAALTEAVQRADAAWAEPQLAAFGAEVGSERMIEAGALANQNPPRLVAFGRNGERRDRVEYHPAWHDVMSASVSAGVHALSWTDARPGANVARAALFLLMNEAENGVSCPLGMTHAAVAPLRRDRRLAAEWEPRITARDYDPSFLPIDKKRGALVGMAMTEREGGSDVRVLTTRAHRVSADTASSEFELHGDKWFFSAPSIWEGSANVICLDVLRALAREPAALPALRREIALAKGADRRLDQSVEALDAELTGAIPDEASARSVAERLVLALQGSLLLRHAPAAVADAFCASRLAGAWGHAFGTLPSGVDVAAIIRRAGIAPH